VRLCHMTIMTEHGPYGMSWQEVAKWFPYAIVALVGVTATVLVQVIGPLALAIVWLCVVLVAVGLYALRKRKEIEEWKSKARKLEEESQVMKMTLAKPALAPTEMPRKQQADNVIIETEIAIPPRDDYEVTSKEMKRGEIEILAQSRSKAAFTFLLLDSANMKRYVQGFSNWEPVLIKPNVSYFKERVKIPRADAWFFIVERTVKDDPTRVRILVTLIGD